MLKVLGAALVVVASGMIGLTISREYQQRPGQLRDLQAALQLLDTEIGYASTPLPDAVVKVGKCVGPPVAGLFSEVAQLLRTRKGYTATEAWQEALKKLQLNSALRPADLEILFTFGHTLGGTDKEEQRKSIQLAYQQLKQQQGQAEEERARNETLWRYAGFLVGMLLVILIY